MKTFPTNDPAVLGPLFDEIGGAVEDHLGFSPKAFVLILTDGETAQTLFGGDDASDMTRLITQGIENHFKRGHGSRR